MAKSAVNKLTRLYMELSMESCLRQRSLASEELLSLVEQPLCLVKALLESTELDSQARGTSLNAC